MKPMTANGWQRKSLINTLSNYNRAIQINGSRFLINHGCTRIVPDNIKVWCDFPNDINYTKIHVRKIIL